MSVVPGFNGRRESSVSSANIQKMLDENVRLIHNLMAHQRCGAVKEATELQQALHRNLVYLATIADRTTSHATSATQAPGNPPMTNGATCTSTGPIQCAQPPNFAPTGGVIPPQPMSGIPMNPNSQPDRNPVINAQQPVISAPPSTEHMGNQLVAQPNRLSSGLMNVPQPPGVMHSQIYPSNHPNQPPNSHEISTQEVPGAPHGMQMGP